MLLLPKDDTTITPMSLPKNSDSDSYTTDYYHTLISLSEGIDSEGLYIYLSKERDIYNNPHSLSPETLTTEHEAPQSHCGILKNPQMHKVMVVEPNVTQEEMDAWIAQAALDDITDAQAARQKQEAQQRARARSIAFIALYRRQHGTTPGVVIKTSQSETVSLVQFESYQDITQPIAIQASG